MTGDTDHAAWINRRTALVGLGMGIATMRWSRVAAAEDPVVETASGRVRGVRQPGVTVFRGIRYGESTAGGRFLPPIAAKPWAGTLDAKIAGNSAPQIPGGGYPIAAWYTKIEPVSEDCLFLNVFAPSATPETKKPVMVWLHGGSWMNCAGSAPGFDGTNLARDGDVVVVTINHRINIFGHIKLESRDERFADSGNTGVLDMVLALKWVRDNVAGFGGDPNNVTIFGQSGGAAKVATLMAFPPARGLFHKAIMQSFSGGAHMRTGDEAARMAHDVAVAAGLQRADAETLQALPMDALIATMKVMTSAVYPIIDNKNFFHHPYDPVMAEGAADIPLLIGNAATEATWFMGGDMKNFDLQDADARNRIGRYLGIDAAETSRTIEAYRASLPDPTPDRPVDRHRHRFPIPQEHHEFCRDAGNARDSAGLLLRLRLAHTGIWRGAQDPAHAGSALCLRFDRGGRGFCRERSRGGSAHQNGPVHLDQLRAKRQSADERDTRLAEISKPDQAGDDDQSQLNGSAGPWGRRPSGRRQASRL